jgi:hypothetical protein
VVAGTALALTCHVCKHSPKVDAQQVSCCGHSFCSACLLQCGQRCGVERCPLCRTQEATVTKDRSFQDGLRLVLVRCKEECCAWQGAFTAVEEHEAVCEVYPDPHSLATPKSHLSAYTLIPIFTLARFTRDNYPVR